MEPLQSDWKYFYKIKIENKGYEIGVMTGQGTSCFCKKVNLAISDEFIDFKDIITDNQKENESLNSFSHTITSLYENEIPLEVITETFNSTISEIKNNEKILIKNKKF